MQISFSLFVSGTPLNHLPVKEIVNKACNDATHYKNAGVVRNCLFHIIITCRD